MTKKDFELIASIIKNLLTGYNKENVAREFSVILASKNPRFDKDKFLQACGVEIVKKEYKQHKTFTYADWDKLTEEYPNGLIEK